MTDQLDDRVQSDAGYQQLIQRGLKARRLQQDEAFNDIIQELRNNLLSAIELARTDDVDTIMSSVRQLRSLRIIQGKLETWVQNGKQAKLAMAARAEGVQG